MGGLRPKQERHQTWSDSLFELQDSNLILDKILCRTARRVGYGLVEVLALASLAISLVSIVMALILDQRIIVFPPNVEKQIRALFGLKQPPDEMALEGKIMKLAELLEGSAALMSEVSGELAIRQQMVDELKAEAARAEEIVTVTSAQQQALVGFVRAEVAREGRKGTRTSLWIGLLYAVAGALLTLAITLFVRPL